MRQSNLCHANVNLAKRTNRRTKEQIEERNKKSTRTNVMDQNDKQLTANAATVCIFTSSALLMLN